MRAYIIRRLLLAVVTVFLISFVAFLLMRLVPGTIVDAIIAQQMTTGDAGVLARSSPALLPWNSFVASAAASKGKAVGCPRRCSNRARSGWPDR